MIRCEDLELKKALNQIVPRRPVSQGSVDQQLQEAGCVQAGQRHAARVHRKQPRGQRVALSP